ncbi:AbiH family protein [Leuconostocaceae bacterium ESL0723]|nr:AbiH family protein [Leuconostocaceae bacterium ESL0723]
MAEQLILLGNGFDLSVGLRTRYTDFFNFQMKKLGANSAEEELDTSIHSILMTLAQSPTDFKELLCQHDTHHYINKINPWYWLLIIERFMEEGGQTNSSNEWSNIEAVMHRYLQNDLIDKMRSTFSSIKALNQYDSHVIDRMGITSAQNELNQISDTIMLKANGEKVDQPIKQRMAVFLLTYKYQLNHEPDFRNLKQHLTNWLYSSLNELENNFENYLKTILEMSDGATKIPVTKESPQTHISPFVNPTEDLLNILVQSDAESLETPEQYNILNFNFTNLYNQKLWGSYPERATDYQPLDEGPEKSLNVHGFFDPNKQTTHDTSHIIFGIDNKDINPNDTNYVFTKTYRTLYAAADSRQNYMQQGSDVFSNDIKIIKFFGHSLGEADYSYFQQMFDYFDLYNDDSLKLYFYFRVFKGSDGQPIDENVLAQQQVEAVVKLIDRYGDTLDNQDHGKNLLTRLQMMKRIVIKRIDWELQENQTEKTPNEKAAN